MKTCAERVLSNTCHHKVGGGQWRGVTLSRLAVLTLLGMLSDVVLSQEFSRYLRCEGSLLAGANPVAAHADFALRFNNQSALIQRSNVLPVGERLAYTVSPFAYAMTLRLKPQGTQVWVMPGWFSNTILVKYPDLKKLNQIRIGIDRQTGVLNGALLNEEDQQLASFAMQCEALSEQDANAPKL